MAVRSVRTWHGSVRKELRQLQRTIARLQALDATRRKGRGGEDYLTQVTNGITLQDTTENVQVQLLTLLAQETTLH